MSPEWLLREGKPFARAFVLSHSAQRAQLEKLTPAALPAAVVAGDPCFDRLVASVPFRRRYRTALGIGDRRLVLISSTWSENSTVGAHFELIRELLAELPRDSYAVAAVIHPAIAHRHGPGLVRNWYADCLRSGLIVLPEIDGWQAGIVAADIVIGDSGSTTGYCAALGTPALLAEFPDVPDGTAISEMGRRARRLPPSGPYLPHIEAALDTHVDTTFSAVTALVTSEPGQALTRLRDLFYRVLELPPPIADVAVAVAATPSITPRPDSFADTVAARIDGDANMIHLDRYPEEVARNSGYRLRQNAIRFLCCSADYPVRALRQRATILVAAASDLEDPLKWLRETLRDNPFCAIALAGDDLHATALPRSGAPFELYGAPPAILAAAAHAWMSANPGVPLRDPIHVEAGPHRYDVRWH